MEQFSLFAEEHRQNKLRALDNCLERHKVIDWELFRPELKRALHKEHKRNAGRPPYTTAYFCSKFWCFSGSIIFQMTKRNNRSTIGFRLCDFSG